MNIKNKLRAGFGFLFLVALICCGLSVYFLNRLSADAKAVLKDNYKTLQYTQAISNVLDAGPGPLNAAQLKVVEQNINKQSGNITEPGEGRLTDFLRFRFDQLKLVNNDAAKSALLKAQIKTLTYQITQLNMTAIERKDAIATRTANQATFIVALIASFCFLVAFTIIVNFPGYIADPIKQLTERIKAVSNRNYHQQLDFTSDDEFGELAQAFNNMTNKLNEYENSNLASILFEKQRIETIINSMQDAIVGLDARQVIIFANRVACTLMGMDEERLAGRYAPDIALENDLLRNLLVNDQVKMKIYADNRESYYSRETLEVKSKDQVIGKVIILKNITEYQQLDEAKTNFIATISHELKTPISSIKMSLKLLADTRIGGVNEEQGQLLKNIDDDTRRLLQITGELLDMAQIENGKIQLNFGSTHPVYIVNYAVQAVKSLADQKAISIAVACPEDLPQVTADLDKATWVLINLLSNAVKYSSDKSVITLTVRHRPKNTIEFSVKDTGRGIDDRYLSRIFERYFKVPGAGPDKTGTGLGLAIAKDFIEAQGGTIGVESEVGEGSRFFFSLKINA